MTSTAKLLILAAALALTACGVVPPAPAPIVSYKPKVIDTACTWTHLITVVDEDKLTDETSRQILAHDRGYLANCKK